MIAASCWFAKEILFSGSAYTRTEDIMMPLLRRKNTITITAAVIIFGCTVFFLNPTQVLADRDAYLQEKYFLNQLNSHNKKRGFLFGKKKEVNNDPAIQYLRQQQSGMTHLLNSAFILIAVIAAWIVALWIFRISSADMATMLCNQISEFTGSFAQRTSEKSRRKRDRNNNNNNNTASPRRAKGNSNNMRTSRLRNSLSDNQSISPSVLEIIDMETTLDDDSSSSYTSSPGVLSIIFNSMSGARKKLMSSSKPKDTPDKRQMDHSSSSRNRKCHRDKSSLRLRSSGKQKSVRQDEEIGEDDQSNLALPGFLHFIEEDECSDNGTEFGIVETPKRTSSKRDKHTHKKTHSNDEYHNDDYHRLDSNGSAPSHPRTSPLQKKLSCGAEDATKHRSHHHSSHHHHSSRRHTKHRASP
jgi:hypothetical protein